MTIGSDIIPHWELLLGFGQANPAKGLTTACTILLKDTDTFSPDTD
jgi:hypothetical protein